MQRYTGGRVVQAEPVRWNRRLSKAFDVTSEQFPARSQEESLVAKFLELEIKHLERRTTTVPSVRMGAWLTAIGEVVSKWTLTDIRNLNRDGEETPPVYEVIQLNSTKSQDFLVDGMRFLRKATDADNANNAEQERASVRVSPTWFGMNLTLYGMRTMGTAEKLLAEIEQRASEINFLKGEAFSLSGEFLPTTAETWTDLFLESKNAAAMQRVVALINNKGAQLDNRGVLLMGPPGTGKTLAARIVRNVVKATFIWVSSRDFHYSGSFGGFSQAFELAKECAPSVVVFEDIDNWLRPTTVDLIKTEMDGVSQSKGVVTMMTTNYPEQLPAALIDRPGRFHDVLRFDLPSAEARKQMLERWLPGLGTTQLAEAVTATDGYSGAHMRELARFALIIAEQDEVTTEKAIASALAKLAEQRELITATQRLGSRYLMLPAVQAKAIALEKELQVRHKYAACGERAYSILVTKSINSETRRFAGVATTPESDRDGDIIESMGVEFTNPMPLLYQHDPKLPVGEARFGQATKDGIPFEAYIPEIAEAGPLKDRLDMAWQSVKAGLIRGASIGFRGVRGFVDEIPDAGLHFKKIRVFELSIVTIPANASARIHTIKSIDLGHPAIGDERPITPRHQSGVSDTTRVVRCGD